MLYRPPAVHRPNVPPAVMIPNRPPAAIPVPKRPIGGLPIPAAPAGPPAIPPPMGKGLRGSPPKLVVPGRPIIPPIPPLPKIPTPKSISNQMNFTIITFYHFANTFNRICKENQINLSILMIDKDPCKPNPCKNGGTCSDGACKCAIGFSGGKCETYGKYLKP